MFRNWTLAFVAVLATGPMRVDADEYPGASLARDCGRPQHQELGARIDAALADPDFRVRDSAVDCIALGRVDRQPYALRLLARFSDKTENPRVRRKALDLLGAPLVDMTELRRIAAGVLRESPPSAPEDAFDFRSLQARCSALARSAPKPQPRVFMKYFDALGPTLSQTLEIGVEYSALPLNLMPFRGSASARRDLHLLVGAAFGSAAPKTGPFYVEPELVLTRTWSKLEDIGTAGLALGAGPRFVRGTRVGTQATLSVFKFGLVLFVRGIDEKGAAGRVEGGLMLKLPLIALSHI